MKDDWHRYICNYCSHRYWTMNASLNGSLNWLLGYVLCQNTIYLIGIYTKQTSTRSKEAEWKTKDIKRRKKVLRVLPLQWNETLTCSLCVIFILWAFMFSAHPHSPVLVRMHDVLVISSMVEAHVKTECKRPFIIGAWFPQNTQWTHILLTDSTERRK